MGPTAFGGNATNPFKVIAPYGDSISYAFELLGVHEVLPNFEEFRRYLAHTTCHLSNLHSAACKNVYALFLGVPPAKVNLTMAPTYMGHSPSGGSITQFKHYAQIASNGGKFRKLDLGPVANLGRDFFTITIHKKLIFSRHLLSRFHQNVQCFVKNPMNGRSSTGRQNHQTTASTGPRCRRCSSPGPPTLFAPKLT